MTVFINALLLALLSSARAASFTTSANGNFNDGGTWGHTSPGVQGTDYPGPGDFFTVTASKLVSTVPGDSISVASGTIFGGTSGSHSRLTINSATFTFTGGGLALLGSSGVSDIVVTSGAVVNLGGYNIVLDAGGFGVNRTWLLGLAAQPIVFNGGGGTFTQGGQGGFDIWDSSWAYVNFSSMATVGLSYGSATTGWAMSSCTWVNSGQLTLPQEQTAGSKSMYRYIEDSDFRGSTSANFLRIRSTNPGVYPAGRNDFWHNTVSSAAATGTGPMEMEVDAPSVTIRGNVFFNSVVAGATNQGLDQTFDGNVMISTVYASGLQFTVLAGSDAITNSLFYCESTNCHYWQQGSAVNTSTQTYSYNIVEENTQGTIVDDGDGYLGSNAGVFSSGTVSHNLVIGHRESLVLMSYLGNASLTTYTTMDNNTVFFNAGATTSHSCFSVGETYAGKGNEFPFIDNNLCVADAADSSGHIQRDLNPGSALQKISTSDYNGSFNVNAAHYQVSGGTYGAHDLSVNPNFVDSTRDFTSWDTSVGGPGTSSDATQNLLRLNGYGGAYNSAYSLAALTSYLKAGFTPQNTALKGAGFDGSDIGAFAVVAAAGSSLSVPPVFGAGGAFLPYGMSYPFTATTPFFGSGF